MAKLQPAPVTSFILSIPTLIFLLSQVIDPSSSHLMPDGAKCAYEYLHILCRLISISAGIVLLFNIILTPLALLAGFHALIYSEKELPSGKKFFKITIPTFAIIIQVFFCLYLASLVFFPNASMPILPLRME